MQDEGSVRGKLGKTEVFLLDFGSLTDILTRLALGLGIGFIAGLTGIGAAVLVIPALIMLGLPAISAVGTGALYAVLMRIFATYEHLKLGNVRKRTAFYISLGGIPFAIVTAFFVLRLERIMGSGIDHHPEKVLIQKIGNQVIKNATLLIQHAAVQGPSRSG